jgi:hypothetical protein
MSKEKKMADLTSRVFVVRFSLCTRRYDVIVTLPLPPVRGSEQGGPVDLPKWRAHRSQTRGQAP